MRRRQIGRRLAEKVVDETIFLMRPRRGALLKEEVWQENGNIVKYSLAYVNPTICGIDNGRVLGNDNSHNQHHRHFMGRQEAVSFRSYEALFRRFLAEVAAIRKWVSYICV